MRAGVLGANDGLLSTASLLVGVAAAHASQSTLLMTGVAALVAGAMSMAAGEYVSVHSQADTEKADLAREKAEHSNDPASELRELTAIYAARGLTPELAAAVAVQLTAHDALGSHARDELGISSAFSANPLQAALSSAMSFVVGAALPLLVTWLVGVDKLVWAVGLASLLFLMGLGALAAYTGGAPILKGMWRVTFWGVLAMLMTAAVGRLFGAVV